LRGSGPGERWGGGGKEKERGGEGERIDLNGPQEERPGRGKKGGEDRPDFNFFVFLMKGQGGRVKEKKRCAADSHQKKGRKAKLMSSAKGRNGARGNRKGKGKEMASVPPG